MKNSDPDILQHPLMGVQMGNLLNLLKANGGVLQNLDSSLLIFFLSALGRWPFTMLDKFLMRGKDSKNSLRSPVVIVGYWRSGTTHLHNLLGQNDKMGIITPIASGLPGELLTLGSWFEGLMKLGLPEDRGVDEVAVTLQSPQEDEIPVANLQTLSVYHALYFPGSFKQSFNRGVFFDGVSGKKVEQWKRSVLCFLRKVARHQNTNQLLLKNPVYTGRVDHILDMWPDARIIHIYRNPYEVYVSTKHYFKKMLKKLALKPYSTSVIEEIVQESYPRMLDKLYSDTENIASDQFAEVRYEDLVDRPIEELEKLYEQLQIDEWERTKSRTESYLSQISDYKTNTYSYTHSDLKAVREKWGYFVEKWGYGAPGEVNIER